jgi:alkylhydroperoxidase family enzyme
MRFNQVDPADMTDDQRALHEQFATGRRAAPGNPFSLVGPDGRLVGPPAVWMLSPRFGLALQQVGGAVRFESRLPARAREIAILLVAHHTGSAFELHAHRLAAAAAGLSEADLDALASGDLFPSASDVEDAVFRTTLLVLARGTLAEEEFSSAVGVLGEGGLFELVTILGWYNMIAWQMAVFDVRPAATS